MHYVFTYFSMWILVAKTDLPSPNLSYDWRARVSWSTAKQRQLHSLKASPYKLPPSILLQLILCMSCDSKYLLVGHCLLGHSYLLFFSLTPATFSAFIWKIGQIWLNADVSVCGTEATSLHFSATYGFLLNPTIDETLLKWLYGWVFVCPLYLSCLSFVTSVYHNYINHWQINMFLHMSLINC